MYNGLPRTLPPCSTYNREGAPLAYRQISFLPTASLCPPTSTQVGSSSIIVETIIEGTISHSPYVRSGFVASTQSGNYKAIIIHHNHKFSDLHNARPLTSLHLLQFNGDLESPSVHNRDRRLELPSYIDLFDIHSIAIDERRGVIYLSNGFGHLFTVPYL